MPIAENSPEGPIRPLSHRASRWLVVLLIVTALAIAVAGSLYLVHSAEEANQRRTQLQSTHPSEVAPTDSSAEAP